MNSSCKLYSLLLYLDLTVRKLVMMNQVRPIHGWFFQDIADCLRQVSTACRVPATSLLLRGSTHYCLVRD